MNIRDDVSQAVRWLRRESRKYRKAEGAFVGAVAGVLALPLAQFNLPSGADWKHALVAGVGATLIAFGVRPNAPQR